MPKYLYLPTVFVLLVCAACNNKPYDPGPVPNTPNNEPAGIYTMASAMSAVAPKEKLVVLSATAGGTFHGNSGTRYEFPPNAFVTATGAAVTGNVEVRVTEYLKKADMLFSGVLPVSDEEPLISGGEVNVNVVQDGQELKLAPGVAFTANMPMKGAAAAGMDLFVGTASAGGKVNWKRVDTATATGGWSKNRIRTLSDSIGITSSTIRYCNADKFMSNPNYQKFSIIVNTDGLDYSEDSITINTVYVEYNGVWPLRRRYGSSNHVYEENHVPDIPVHFVVFAIIKGNFYAGVTSATPVTGGMYTVYLKKTIPNDFKTVVAAL